MGKKGEKERRKKREKKGRKKENLARKFRGIHLGE
jgi:hypothetical protein